jgi:hypothetical protein
LRELVSSDPDCLIWGEGVAVPGIVLCDRTGLHNASALIVWTAPPDPNTLHAALKTVEPRHVILFGADPNLDAPRTFLPRLLGLIKHVIHKQGGQTSLAALAAATAQTEGAVRLALEWMARKNQIGLTMDKRAVSISQALGQAQPGDADLRQQARLQAQLQETAAYRAYFAQAQAGRLINESETALI